MRRRLRGWALTGLADDDVVGDGGAVLVAGGALVHPLVGLHPPAADVDDQGARARLHGHFGVLLHVEVRAVPGPGEAASAKNRLTTHTDQWDH